MRPTFEVADIFRRHGSSYRRENAGHLGHGERRVMGAIEACRTPRLGGHVDACDDCGRTRISYNSCRNRHCPEVSRRGPQGVGRCTRRRPVAGSVLPCRLHATAGHRRDRLPQQGGRLCIADAHRGPDAADRCRRPQAAGRRDRHCRRASHLGPGHDPSSPRSLRL
ncbi:transposase zinc-binding domain-containing protein [Ensifer sp. ENS04]|nr:transposase zinc-binding domain-containing protein [Ensifer sp. ENS04]